MRNMFRFVFLFVVILLIDLYVFRTIRLQASGFSNYAKYLIYFTHWLVPLLILFSTIYLFLSTGIGKIRPDRFVFFLVGFFILFYIPKLFIILFQIIEDLSKIMAWVTKKISAPDGWLYVSANNVIKSVYIGRVGLIIAIIPFLSIVYGVIYGRYKFEVKNVRLVFNDLPSAFNGLKIVQFSDFHVGSLAGKQSIYKKAINLINQQNPDIIVFTGDMVNTSADELDGWIDLIGSLKAKEGKFSVLGNHDYGDYIRWESDSAKIANLEKLKNYHKEMGFNLLQNQAVIFERDGQSIAILGVENWGEKPFPQHGKLNLAIEESNGTKFKVLLSHDPTHWEHEVLEKSDVALTLSGHTHGMQMAINIANFSWSPVSLKYPRWKGLYSENDQYLYVNLGLGYIGFPGRVGTNPEITVFELVNPQN